MAVNDIVQRRGESCAAEAGCRRVVGGASNTGVDGLVHAAKA